MAVGVKLHDELNYGMKECPAAEPVSQSIDIQAGVTMEKKELSVIEQLAEIYPQLYLDPDSADIEEYKACVRKGERPAECGLSHFVMDERDCAEDIDTPAGVAKVITLHNRHDFEIFVRIMLAAKEGPDKKVPQTMGASTIVAFNWPRINAHREAFLEEQRAVGVPEPDWSAEFKRFTSVRENYQDLLIVLSCGPYSNVDADRVNELLTEAGHEGISDDAWRELSGKIRKYHELTHFVCRKLYPDKIEVVWDELVADAVGIYGAFGGFRKDLEELFLGISGCRYTGGRLENYTEESTDLDELVAWADSVLGEFEMMISRVHGSDVFGIMKLLEDSWDRMHR